MAAAGLWSLESVHDGFEKMESGLIARAIDFARFGRLYLKRGNWEGQQLVPSAWVAASTHHPSQPDPSTSSPGEERAHALGYGFMWWIDPGAIGASSRWATSANFLHCV